MDKIKFCFTWLMLFLMMVILTMPVSAGATDRNWVGGNEEYGYQMWYLGNNWDDGSGNPGVPQTGDQVYITNSGSQVGFNVLAPSLGYMQIDNNSALTFVGFGNLTAANTDVGYDGVGTINMGWGWHTVNGDLRLGVNSGSQGNYNMGSGTLQVNGNTIIGVAGNGYFDQSGGTHTVSGDLVLAKDSGNSFYFLSGDSLSTLTVGGSTIVGMSGTGTFEQTGGTHTAGWLTIGGNGGYMGGTGTGTYTLDVAPPLMALLISWSTTILFWVTAGREHSIM